MKRPERLSLHCESLDELLGGGVEHGVVTNVYGEAGSGKTNFCMQAVVAAVAMGEKAIVIDTEGGFSAERFLQMHPDDSGLERVLLYEPTTFDEQRDVFDKLPDVVADESPSLIVVDSLVALYRLNLSGDDVSETNTELSRQFSVLSKLARKKELPVIVTNQVYSQFDSDELELVGRDIPAYWSKILLELKKAGRNTRRAVLQKHRSRPEGLEARFEITDKSLVPAEESGDRRMKIF